MKKLAPIILFVYNRPNHTKQVVEGLLRNPEAKDSILFIFADGPKPNISQEGLEKLKQVRDFIHTIKGFKEIYIDESDENRGLANATIRGCTSVINEYGNMIVMEDDDVPSPYFLSYVNRCLEKYKDDERIWCVSGYTDTSILPPVENGDDLFFVNRPSSWGFGTWKRCWDKVIWDIPTLKGLFTHQSIISGYNNWAGADASNIMFGLFQGRNSSWSVRYNFAAYLNRSMTILPNKSLIENTGCDGSGTHCGIQNLNCQLFDRNIVIPNEICFDSYRNKKLIDSFNPKTIKGRILYFINCSICVKKILIKLGITRIKNNPITY